MATTSIHSSRFDSSVDRCMFFGTFEDTPGLGSGNMKALDHKRLEHSTDNKAKRSQGLL